jgi:hypothetical protein
MGRAQDTFYVGNMKGVGSIYQQTFIGTYAVEFLEPGRSCRASSQAFCRPGSHCQAAWQAGDGGAVLMFPPSAIKRATLVPCLARKKSVPDALDGLPECPCVNAGGKMHRFSGTKIHQ